MDALPRAKNISLLASNRLRRWLFVFLVLVVFLLIFINFFLLKLKPVGSNDKGQNLAAFLEEFKTETATLDFPSEIWRERLFKTYTQASSEDDESRQLDVLKESFDILRRVYIIHPTKAFREKLEKFNNYLKSNYEELYEEKNFQLVCLDDSCPESNLPDEVKGLKTQIEGLDSIKQKVKQQALQSIRQAALSEENGEAWSHYDASFQLLHSAYKEKPDRKLKEILEKFVGFIKKNYEKEYGFILKVEGGKNHYIVD